METFAERSEGADGLRTWVAAEEQPAAGPFEELELARERALVCPEYLGGLVEAGVFGEDDEAGETLTGASSDEHQAKRLRELGGVDSGKIEVGEPFGTGTPSQWDVVLVGEDLEGGDLAAELGGYVGQGPPPGHVLVAQPRRIERDRVVPGKRPGPVS